jgi:DNA-binding response OmpR family regulator
MSQQPVICNRTPTPVKWKKGEEGARRPLGRIVLAVGDMPHGPVLERCLQERGWKVHVAATGAEARSVAYAHDVSVAVLAAEPARDESGWLTCWKLLHDRRKVRVLIVGAQPAERGQRMADFVGAAGYVPASASASAIAGSLPTAGIV